MNPAAVFVSPKTACTLLGVHRSTLLRWETEGKIRPRRLNGGHRRYLLADLRALLSTAQDKAISFALTLYPFIDALTPGGLL